MEYLDQSEKYFGFYDKDGKYLITAAFDPITGDKIESGFDSYFVGVSCREFNGKEKGNKKNIENRVLEHIAEWKSMHTGYNQCSRLYDLILGDDAGTTRAAYFPMIRAYIIYKKYAHVENFDVMDYCPFCGAKLPERLDGKLTEILQKEYGLASWKDYKKAPKEFHSDEWWRKRGL